MKSWKKPTDEMIEKALASVRKETDRRYFFSRLKNPLWLQPLVEHGHFKTPLWPELQYLKTISRNVPDEVTNIVLKFPKVDNQRVYYGILEIALELPGRQSAKLKPKVLEGARLDSLLLEHRYRDLLVHWTAENETSAALELVKVLVAFEAGPNPSPRIRDWGYQDLLKNGVQPLAQKVPYEVAHILINATANMIRLQIRGDVLDAGSDEDHSEIWCPRLSESGSRYEQSMETLVHALAFACEQVLEKAPNSIVALDKALKNQRWKFFRRLRQHLYALNPTVQTKPWIRNFILEHEDYCRWEHHYEFQRMIRCACEPFGVELLTEEERTSIFEAILCGPSEAHYQEWIGEKFTKELFNQRQRYFHRKQLSPFASVLFGKYLKYFQELEDEADSPISDDDYIPLRRAEVGEMLHISQRPPRDITRFTDEKLLEHINDWDAESRDHYDWTVEITIGAQAEAFQSVFRESILPDANRFQFWLENRERVERPIYVRAMINGMQEYIKGKNFDRLEESLSFCEWVLTHQDRALVTSDGYSDQSREHPHWSSSRRAIADLIETCLEEEINVPIAVRKQLAKLLEMLCTQFDWRLDSGKKVSPDENDQYTEAINNTRSRALERLVRFGWWLRENDQQAEVSMVTMILEKRFSPESEYSLTLPERALLGVNYSRVLGLDEAWAVERRADFFPRDSLAEWREAFGSFLRFNRPHELMFGVLRDDFAFAVQHLVAPEQPDHSDEDFLAFLGRHLFTYYLWGLYPLKGTDSLLQRFYQRTDGDRQRWRHLFGHVGFLLRNTDKNLEESLKDRIITFFEWRLEVGEAAEFGDFHFWLVSEALETEWRLDAYSRILGLCQDHDLTMMSIETDALGEMIPDYTAKVVECFAKLTGRLKEDTFYIRTETAKRILQAGLESSDQGVRDNAARARDNLLRRSRFDLLDLS